jgi:hypothetical protein
MGISLPLVVQLLQAATGLAWLMPAALLLPSVVRTWRGTADAIDAMRGPIIFFSVVQVGFSARWLVWPHALPLMETAELSTWAGLYTLSILCAVGVVVANHYARKLRK